MSKQVELKGDTLIVTTREDYFKARKVIFTKKGKTARAFFAHIPQVIADLDALEDMAICGFRAAELVKLAEILRGKGYDDVDLRAYNDCFFNGYKRATEDCEKALKDSCSRLIKSIDDNNDTFKGGLL